MSDRVFRDRRDAGRALAGLLDRHRGRPDVVVLGLPRGGVPVAYEIARALRAPLDVFVVRKLGVPDREELAMGAIASGGVVVINDPVVRALAITEDVIQQVADREGRELARREQAYRDDRPVPELEGRTVVLVDDGLATGSSMRAAVRALREHGPGLVVVAVPVAPAPTCREFRGIVDEVVCATTPSPFVAVGAVYRDFSQTTDEEVRDLLRAAEALFGLVGDTHLLQVGEAPREPMTHRLIEDEGVLRRRGRRRGDDRPNHHDERERHGGHAEREGVRVRP